MNRDEALAKAGELINGQRHEDYGDASKNFDDIAKLWSPILGIEVEPWRVALCMMQLKVARIFKTPTHEDSWVDGIGYLALGAELAATSREGLMSASDALAARGWKVGDVVAGSSYGRVPVGTTVIDHEDAGEGPATRISEDYWRMGGEEILVAHMARPRIITHLP